MSCSQLVGELIVRSYPGQSDDGTRWPRHFRFALEAGGVPIAARRDGEGRIVGGTVAGIAVVVSVAVNDVAGGRDAVESAVRCGWTSVAREAQRTIPRLSTTVGGIA